MKKRLFVVDGHALCYRAYYAFIRNPLFNSEGQNTSAIYGFARMLFKLIDEQKPDYLLVAFDPPVKTFRFELYPQYKANRQKMPDDLKVQIDEIKSMIDVLGIKRFEDENYEADDVMGSIAEQYASEDMEVVLVTGDKDALQLVNENVTIYANKKGISDYEVYTPHYVRERYGFEPEQIIDFMALVGDASDNIPGVKGIGEKTAGKLISRYKSLENLYNNIDDLSGRQKELLIRDEDMAFLSRKLATIKKDLHIKINSDDISYKEIKSEKAKEYLKNIEMYSIVRDFFGDGNEEAKSINSEKDIVYKIVRNEDELKRVIKRIRENGEVAIDTETTSLDQIEAELIGISLSVKEKEGWYIPLRSRALFSDDFPDRNISLFLLGEMIEDPDIKKIGHNIKYDLNVLKNENIEMKGIYFDTMVASYLISPGDRRHNLDDLSSKILNHRTIKFKELTGTGKNAIPIEEVPLERLAEYAAEDADITYRLYRIFKTKLVDNELDKLFYEIEMPLVIVLAEMERKGVKIDLDHFKRLGMENDNLLKKVVENIYREAGETFNVNSTRELADILFNKLGLKAVKKTKTGFSTDITVLEALRGSHNIIDYLISYRTFSKLKSTYIDALPRMVSKKTGRIHASYNQTVVVTGRLSSSNPNLQNIPIRDYLGRDIRKGFIAEKGYLIMAADYSQIELRLAAHLSGDENMINAFKEGVDIHSLTAASVAGVDIDQVDSEMRRQAKIVNFAIIYGVSPYGLAQQADIGVKEAAWFIRIYFEKYPGFKEYMERTIEFARKHGYVKTMLGRKRVLPHINSDVSFRREGAERAAINTPIQGTSADMIKIAMININKELKEKNLKSEIIMQVHDELVLEVHEDEKEETGHIVRDKMENALTLSVPVVVDIGLGKNWDEAH